MISFIPSVDIRYPLLESTSYLLQQQSMFDELKVVLHSSWYLACDRTPCPSCLYTRIPIAVEEDVA